MSISGYKACFSPHDAGRFVILKRAFFSGFLGYLRGKHTHELPESRLSADKLGIYVIKNNITFTVSSLDLIHPT